RGADPGRRRGAPERARKRAREGRKSSIFTRVTNRAFDIARQTGADLRDATPAAMLNRVAKSDPVMRPPAPAPQPAVQPRLALDPAERIAPRPSEEDLLDIPAFLPRQANCRPRSTSGPPSGRPPQRPPVSFVVSEPRTRCRCCRFVRRDQSPAGLGRRGEAARTGGRAAPFRHALAVCRGER